jgi:hypothetical protein
MRIESRAREVLHNAMQQAAGNGHSRG